MDVPDPVAVFDTTLRDGEQSPGISLDVAEKVEIAAQLGRLGVDVIEAGFPVASPADRDAVAAVAELFGDGSTTVAALCRTNLADIEMAAGALHAAGSRRLHVFIATSDLHLSAKLRMTRAQVLAAAAEGVAFARSFGCDVEFSPEDASRSDFGFMCDVLRAAVDAGASVLNIPDTVGWSTPGEYADRLRAVRAAVAGDWTLSAHCHDDLGLAVANTLAAVDAGAGQVHVTVNGIGERAGNAALEEVVMALAVRRDRFGGRRTRVVTAELARTSRLVSRLTGYPVAPNKAVVGTNAFAHESGIHQHGVLSDRSTYEIMNPTEVGQDGTRIVLGKHSGRHAFARALADLGFRLHGDALGAAFAAFKELADRKADITDADLEAVAASEVRGLLGRGSELVGYRVTVSSDAAPSAAVEVDRDGKVTGGAGTGDGAVSAVCAAVSDAVGDPGTELVELRVSSVTRGEDSLADVVVGAARDGRRVSGRGLSADVVEASAKAWLDALDRIDRTTTAARDGAGP
jgi:2-isopropylmalate synthase